MAQLETAALALTLLTRVAIPQLSPSLTEYLENESVLFSTLITSYKSLNEGIFFFKNNLNIYDGGVVHTPPLLIYIIGEFFQGLEIVLWPFIDVIICFTLINISKKFPEKKLKPWVIGFIYALNPIGIMENISKSWLIFHSLFTVILFHCSLNKQWLAMGFFLSLCSYLHYQSLVLIIPIIKISNTINFAKTLFVFFVTSTVLYLASYKLSNNSNLFINSTYLTSFYFAKISPNLGLWWYFFIEMFEFFIPFYTQIFNLLQIVFIIPLSLRLPFQFSFLLSVAIIKFGNNFAELTDLILISGLFLTQSYIFGHLKLAYLGVLLLIMAVILAPIFYHLWINLGSGNSNFFYAITLLYNLGLAISLVDYIWAVLQWEFKLDTKNKNVNKIGLF
ncbi:hypothetical protein WICMUC_002076 [Wickerhamomyces mucosus]|uniref:GPI transamidase component GAB1 n=1 Tax=Wickerhamomyces mucosus TaxID=1378264 RepID=A0A9P8TF95_9ASCO|nr:hypothetical protein WICMUC_002076 [Wickerhamomyces mucosus]